MDFEAIKSPLEKWLVPCLFTQFLAVLPGYKPFSHGDCRRKPRSDRAGIFWPRKKTLPPVSRVQLQIPCPFPLEGFIAKGREGQLW